MDLDRVQAFATRQQQSQWCWAACISMLFGYYGHPVSQERIVKEVYGSAANMPAGAGWVLARELNRTLEDDDGVTFTSTVTRAYDADARINNLDNDWLIDELTNDRPFIIGARSHAMVVTHIVYETGAAGLVVKDVGVVDPWPGSKALRSLAIDEVVPVELHGSLRFIATVSVDG